MQSSGAVKRIIAELCFVKMCDELLSTSNEALLLRISKLEAQLANATLGAGVQEIKTEAVQKQKEEKLPEKKAKATDAPRPEIKEEIKPKAVSEAKPQRTSKALKCWTEVVSRVAGIDSGASAFLKRSRAYEEENGNVRVTVEKFAIFILDRPETKATIASALMQYTGKKYSAENIVYEAYEGVPQKDNDDMDDIINSID